ncbi:MAG: VTT domain-containing protein [Candidatus Lambdaproteobacteria bacterium]|nr:VTT domain-containing protein [Candidatus Lambdaproteobacteria bacterium]
MAVRRLARLVPVTAIVLGVALGIALGIGFREHLAAGALLARLGQLGPWAPLALIALWLIAPVLFVPGAPITLAAGALFGPALGAVYSLIGATAGSTLAFLLSRYAAGGWVERRARGRLAQLKAGVETEGWRFVAFVRLVPLFPFNLLNYALGLTRIPLGQYVAATVVCMVPGAAGYAYLGYAGREALTGAQGWVRSGGIALGVLAALILLPWMLRHWRSHRTVTPATLAGWMDQGREIQVLDVRSAKEYRGPDDRIEPSLLIPIDELERRLGELEPQRHRSVVVV